MGILSMRFLVLALLLAVAVDAIPEEDRITAGEDLLNSEDLMALVQEEKMIAPDVGDMSPVQFSLLMNRIIIKASKMRVVMNKLGISDTDSQAALEQHFIRLGKAHSDLGEGNISGEELRQRGLQARSCVKHASSCSQYASKCNGDPTKCQSVVENCSHAGAACGITGLGEGKIEGPPEGADVYHKKAKAAPAKKKAASSEKKKAAPAKKKAAKKKAPAKKNSKVADDGFDPAKAKMNKKHKKVDKKAADKMNAAPAKTNAPAKMNDPATKKAAKKKAPKSASKTDPHAFENDPVALAHDKKVAAKKKAHKKKAHKKSDKKHHPKEHKKHHKKTHKKHKKHHKKKADKKKANKESHVQPAERKSRPWGKIEHLKPKAPKASEVKMMSSSKAKSILGPPRVKGEAHDDVENDHVEEGPPGKEEDDQEDLEARVDDLDDQDEAELDDDEDDFDTSDELRMMAS